LTGSIGSAIVSAASSDWGGSGGIFSSEVSTASSLCSKESEASGGSRDVEGSTTIEGSGGTTVPCAGIVSSGSGVEKEDSNGGDDVEFSAVDGPGRKMRQKAKRK